MTAARENRGSGPALNGGSNAPLLSPGDVDKLVKVTLPDNQVRSTVGNGFSLVVSAIIYKESGFTITLLSGRHFLPT